MVDLEHQVSELQNENEQLEKENGELKLAQSSKKSSFHPGVHQDDQLEQNEQVHELQDKVTQQHRVLCLNIPKEPHAPTYSHFTHKQPIGAYIQ